MSSRAGLLIVVSGAVASTLVAACAAVYLSQKRRFEEEMQECERRRLEERTGRIRAEVKLRSSLQKQKNMEARSVASSGGQTEEDLQHSMLMQCIGTVVSPYTKRMGTPRQGALVPSSRGFIQFNKDIRPQALEGIDEYSHIWVLFGFHANTSLATSKKTKVRPPRGNGIKVGHFATRSPHRSNPIGLSLVCLESWDQRLKRLHISGLDLVNGTPVYDIKPYIHWDIPGTIYDTSLLQMPDWVESRDDVLSQVSFSDTAKESLRHFVQEDNRLAPLYDHRKDKFALEDATQTIMEILAQDPRSSHKGAAKNQRGSISSEVYPLIFGKLEAQFVVDENGANVVDVIVAQNHATLVEAGDDR